MPEVHKFYLSLGSNIDPVTNLGTAIERLRIHGRIEDVSSVWESHAVGSAGPDFLNVCLSLRSALDEAGLKGKVLLPIESALGRIRTADKNAPRPIDIDILMMDERPLNLVRWSYPFVIVPMADIAPHLLHPVTGREMQEVARQTQAETWIVKRPIDFPQSPTG